MIATVPVSVFEIKVFEEDGLRHMRPYGPFDSCTLILTSFGCITIHPKEVVDTLPFLVSALPPPSFPLRSTAFCRIFKTF